MNEKTMENEVVINNELEIPKGTTQSGQIKYFFGEFIIEPEGEPQDQFTVTISSSSQPISEDMER